MASVPTEPYEHGWESGSIQRVRPDQKKGKIVIFIRWPVVSAPIPHPRLTPCLKEMPVPRHFLYVTNNHTASWSAVLDQAITPLGTLEISSSSGLCEQDLHHVAILFVDASYVPDIVSFIRGAHQLCPNLPIIVVTASPTWKRAREAMQAGATDYIRKSSDVAELHRIVYNVLQSSTPPATSIQS